MTLVSLQELAKFINKYSPHGVVADFGGLDSIGAQIVTKMLSLKEVSVKNISETDLEISLRGKPYTPAPIYKSLDYDNGVDLMLPIKSKKFDFGISMDLLEHTPNPFIVAENISNSLKKGAILFVTVPMIWEQHFYPIDTFRFMPQGLELLFPKMKKISIDVVRDYAPDEEINRTRLVGIFQKK